MTNRQKAGRHVLRRYEGGNLLFFLGFILALGIFVSWVFQSYRSPNAVVPPESPEKGILSEIVTPGSETCVFYLGTKLSETNHRYRSRTEIPATDDGLVAGLFGIPGVEVIVVDGKMLMLQKSPLTRWERIQPSAREVIKSHLHMHQ
ncbi:MAG TPA: NifU N-terminal domain-containing protein [Acidobacteriota bacterium]|nr:NifU N-terminal domain-containing protein [Acidobacteriota bacterium]